MVQLVPQGLAANAPSCLYLLVVLGTDSLEQLLQVPEATTVVAAAAL
jgi:hypothetical protein